MTQRTPPRAEPQVGTDRSEPAPADRLPPSRPPTAGTGLTAAEVAERVALGRTNADDDAHQPHDRRDRPRQRAHRLQRHPGRPCGCSSSPPGAGRTRCSASSSSSTPAIGIVQEVRAKRTLDRLAVLNAPRARVRARRGRARGRRSPTSSSTTCWCSRAGDQVPADGVVRDDERAVGRRVAAHRRGRAGGQGAGRRGLVGGDRRRRSRPGAGDGGRGGRPTPPGWRPRPGGSPRPTRSWSPAPTGCCAGSRSRCSSSARLVLWSQFRTADNAGLARRGDRHGRRAGRRWCPRGWSCSRRWRSSWRRWRWPGGRSWCRSCRRSRAWPGSTSSAWTRPARSPTATSRFDRLDAARRPSRRGAVAALGLLAAADPANATAAALAAAFPTGRTGDARGSVPFSSARKWRAVTTGDRADLGARRAGDGAAAGRRRTQVAARARRRARRRPGAGCCCSRGRPTPARRRRRRRPAGRLEPGRAGAS